MDNFESKMTIKQKQLVDCGYATEEELEDELEGATDLEEEEKILEEDSKNKQLVNCGYATAEEVGQTVKNAQKALDAILGNKGLNQNQKEGLFLDALCGK